MSIIIERRKVRYTCTFAGSAKCKICKRGFLHLSDLQKHKVKHYRLGLYYVGRDNLSQSTERSHKLQKVKSSDERMVNKVNDCTALNDISSPLQKDSGIDDCSPLSYDGYCEQGKTMKSVLPTVYPPCPQTKESHATPTMQQTSEKDNVIDLRGNSDDEPKKIEDDDDYSGFLVKNHNEDTGSDCKTCSDLCQSVEKIVKEKVDERYQSAENDVDKRLETTYSTENYAKKRLESTETDPDKKWKLTEIDVDQKSDIAGNPMESSNASSNDNTQENSFEELNSQCNIRVNGQCKVEAIDLLNLEQSPSSNGTNDDFVDLNSSYRYVAVENSMEDHSNLKVFSKSNYKVDVVERCSVNPKDVHNDTMDTLNNIEESNEIVTNEDQIVSDDFMDTETVANTHDKAYTESSVETKISSTNEFCHDSISVVKSLVKTNTNRIKETKPGTNKVIESLFELFTSKVNTNNRTEKSDSEDNITGKEIKLDCSDKDILESKSHIKDSFGRNIFELMAQEAMPAVHTSKECEMDTSETATVSLDDSLGEKTKEEDVNLKDNKNQFRLGNDFESATGESQFNFYDSNNLVTLPTMVNDVMYKDCYLGDLGQFSSQNPESSSQEGYSDSDDCGAADTPSKYVTLSQDSTLNAQTPMRDMLKEDSDMDLTPVKSAKKPADFQCEYTKFLLTSSQKKQLSSSSTVKQKNLFSEFEAFRNKDKSGKMLNGNFPPSFISSSKSHVMSSRQEKSLLTSHQKLISLRRKVCKLLHNVFPHIEYPKYFKTNSCCVEALLDQIISIIRSPDGHKYQKIQAIPTEDSCFSVTVVLCKNPRFCIKNLRKKIMRFLQNILPHLELSPNFDIAGEMVDELLKKVILFNDPAKKVSKYHHKT